ncbi:PAS domain-containing sensor histidine kinase [Thalassobellus citreus]|uniref:PAS domain-containing sensor histidine kinase n=1 Tax=Thalassobellus citreus TaxID=3367752 RepID=UPI00379E6D29
MEVVSKAIWNNIQEEQLIKALNRTVIVSITDPKGLIIHANSAFCEISGYTEQELLGKNHNILKSGKQPDALFVGMWELIKKNEVWSGEICNKKKDGSYYWVKTTIIPFLDKQGEIKKYVSIRFDITKSKEHKSDLKLVQDKFKFLFDATLDAYFITDLQGGVLECNAATIALFGYDKNEIINKKISEIGVLSEADRVLINRMMKIPSAKPIRNEFQITSKSGDKKDIEVVAHQMHIEGEQFVLYIAHDISIRKSIYKKLEDKTNDLELLLYRSGHDLRAPFTSLEGLLNLMRQESLSESTVEILNMFENVLQDGKRLVDNLSTASLMLNKSVVNEVIDFNKLVYQTINNLSQIEGFNDISFNINIAKGFKINSNLQLVSSLLQNIIQNAIKYRRPIGASHTPFIIISAFNIAKGVKISIKDNGIGINKNELDKVFNLYYRSNNLIEGTGLGLYISKNIVDQLKGTMSVQSVVNKMSQFDISLPNSI